MQEFIKFLTRNGVAYKIEGDNLNVGGSLYLEGTQITILVTGLGRENRTAAVWHKKNVGPVISLGCFTGSEAEAIPAISEKYSGKSATDYCDGVRKAFKLYAEK
jgi:hypothetical protein